AAPVASHSGGRASPVADVLLRGWRARALLFFSSCRRRTRCIQLPRHPRGGPAQPPDPWGRPRGPAPLPPPPRPPPPPPHPPPRLRAPGPPGPPRPPPVPRPRPPRRAQPHRRGAAALIHWPAPRLAGLPTAGPRHRGGRPVLPPGQAALPPGLPRILASEAVA